jgi:prevent-host-death family protein
MNYILPLHDLCYKYNMRSIGIRELRQNASRYLRDVEAGETIEVTDRGRPVARLVPVPVVSGLGELIAAGRVIPARDDLLALGPPVAAAPGVPLPSELLADMRAGER